MQVTYNSHYAYLKTFNSLYNLITLQLTLHLP